jgi:hypothetical protein
VVACGGRKGEGALCSPGLAMVSGRCGGGRERLTGGSRATWVSAPHWETVRDGARCEPLTGEAHRSATADATRAVGAARLISGARVKREKGTRWGKLWHRHVGPARQRERGEGGVELGGPDGPKR